MRKRYSAQFKAEVVQEVLQERRTVAEIASERGIHPNQIYRWKEIALHGLPSLFDDEAQAAKQAAAEHEKPQAELYAEIGRLTTQLRWLEKKWPQRSAGLTAWRWLTAPQLNCRWLRSANS